MSATAESGWKAWGESYLVAIALSEIEDDVKGMWGLLQFTPADAMPTMQPTLHNGRWAHVHRFLIFQDGAMYCKYWFLFITNIIMWSLTVLQHCCFRVACRLIITMLGSIYWVFIITKHYSKSSAWGFCAGIQPMLCTKTLGWRIKTMKFSSITRPLCGALVKLCLHQESSFRISDLHKAILVLYEQSHSITTAFLKGWWHGPTLWPFSREEGKS